jgi:hypothetical protein
MPVSDYSTTPADNTAISGLAVSNATVVNTLDDIIRQIMADIRLADDQNIKLTGDQTATGTKTFGSVVGGTLRSTASSTAILTLQATSQPTTHNQTRLLRDGASFKQQTSSSTATPVADDYVATVGSLGVTSHQWNIQGANRFSISDNRAIISSPSSTALDIFATNTADTHEGFRLFKDTTGYGFATISASLTGTFDYFANVGASGATGHSFRTLGVERLFIDASGCTALAFTPTSDARIKDDIRDLNEIERRAAAKIKVRTYTLKENGQRKIGYVAQEIIEAMASEGLDAFHYGLVIDGPIYAVDYDAVNAFRMG